MNLAGKNALVTGGGSGIGLGIARAMANAGCRTAICGRREAVLSEAASAPSHPELLAHPVDVADRDSVRRLFEWATESLGQIDILVNSAGTNIKTRTMEAMSPEQWDSVLSINATGTYNCMYAVLPQMRARKDGLIINVSSIAGLRASSLGGVAYSASKFAMAALGTSVANEVGPDGVRVTNVFPGEVNTPILENRPNPVSDEHKARILQPEDFGEVIVAIAALPPRAHISDIVIKPTSQGFM
jgi:NAD(P)-dependent dehydrogenase (short-subunit alcohol dehydrogenase family)